MVYGQNPKSGRLDKEYWNSNLMVNALRLPPPPIGYKPKLVDLDHDGDPDLLYSITKNNIPVLWIDDDDDMAWTDMEGDTDSDCVLIDRNKDGKYGHMGDFIIDWTDSNGDGKADMQVLVEYPESKRDDPWPNGHYMWVLDTDEDNVFNYIDWNSFQIKAWDKYGISDFFLDYSGKSTFIKIHVATNTMKDLRLNWENPFLFYDPDKDGLSEMAVRLVDSPDIKLGEQKPGYYQVNEKGTIDWVSISIDSDNDNGPGNEFDFDFTINFRGKGFNYMDQVHKIKNMRGLPAADSLFLDPRWRQMNELIYADHDKALDLTFNKGKWSKVYFVYDEDDDCNRWERVELLDPLDPFKSGTGKGGLDNNVQADVAGDRGEWDMDNSGNGKLYISKFDGRIHLFGAEWGAWRIDQNASLYQGWDRKFLNREAGKFATVKYEDTDNNGFMDKMLFDLDGDKVFEDSIELSVLGLSDSSQVIDISKFKYEDYVQMQKNVSEGMWNNAQLAISVAKKYGLNLSWYAKWMVAVSLSQKYNNGYWLQFYIYRDLKDLFLREDGKQNIQKLERAYYGSNWKLM
ncbi:hypothetical protein DRW42_09800 [Pedobacter miscanthi]|uniref:Uncharacterized protein n=1 Tax=Pedobacter miscanthi TaxID=2259170 RepID=A0A366L262_9SPHI|nr:hypothetical protein DRW42_09800 [Pedobacter miscanthi]